MGNVYLEYPIVLLGPLLVGLDDVDHECVLGVGLGAEVLGLLPHNDAINCGISISLYINDNKTKDVIVLTVLTARALGQGLGEVIPDAAGLDDEEHVALLQEHDPPVLGVVERGLRLGVALKEAKMGNVSREEIQFM